MGIGEIILEHYEEYFGDVYSSAVYSMGNDLPTIQVLKWNNLTEDCTIFATFGLSQYYNTVQNLCELVTVVDSSKTKYISDILGNIALASIEYQMSVQYGLAYNQVRNISSKFVQEYHKNGIYFGFPYVFPDDFFTIDFNGNSIQFLMAMFIDEKEFKYYKNHGYQKLEDIWVEKGIDLLDINRKAVI